MTPKETAIKEVNKRIVTKEQAKKDYIKWIKDNIHYVKHSDFLTKFWNDTIKEVEKL